MLIYKIKVQIVNPINKKIKLIIMTQIKRCNKVKISMKWIGEKFKNLNKK